jgi:hypothetical protein
MQQGLGYATALDVPFVFSSNGDGFLFHDRTGTFEPVEQTLSLDEFPSPDELWTHYKQWKSLETVDETLITSPYYQDNTGKAPPLLPAGRDQPDDRSNFEMFRLWARLRGLVPAINQSALDDAYIEQASTTTCPECGVKRSIGSLVVREIDGTWAFEV